jgi:hypothetical protein
MTDCDFVIFTDIGRDKALSIIEALADEHDTLFVTAQNAPLHGYKLYLNAMTFDLNWTAPTGSADANHLEYRQILLNSDLSKFNRISLCIGNHIVQDRISLPVFETYAELGRLIAKAVDAVAIAWRPSGNAIGIDYYADAISRFMRGGPFPVLGFIDLQEAGNHIYQTYGLGYFAGYELRLHALPGVTTNMAMRIMVRLVNDIIINGDFADGTRIPGHADNVSIVVAHKDQDDGNPIKGKIVEAMMTKG